MTNAFRRQIKEILLIVISSLLCYLAITKSSYMFGMLCLVPLFFVLKNTSGKDAFGPVLLFGLTLSVLFFSWVIKAGTHYTGNGLLLSLSGFVVCVSLYTLSLCLVFYSFFTVRKSNRLEGLSLANAFSIAIIWMVVEEIRLVVLSGFPFLDLRMGYALADNLYAVQWVSLFGTGILTFFVIFINMIMAGIIDKLIRRPNLVLFPIFLMIAIPGLGYVLQHLLHTSIEAGPRHRIALVTHNLPPEVTWNTGSERELSALYFNLHKEALALYPELMIWTESAIPWVYQKGDFIVETLTKESYKAGAELVLGVNRAYEKEKGSILNSVVLFDKKGDEQVYDKRFLLSLIESPLLPGFLNFLLPMMGSDGIRIHRGDSDNTLKSVAGSIGIRICNEAVFPIHFNKEYHPDMLLVIGNDSWFEDTYIPFLHLLVCRLRALESGRDVIINISRGYTGLASADGSFIKLETHKEPHLSLLNITKKNSRLPASYLPYWFSITGVITLVLLKLLKPKPSIA